MTEILKPIRTARDLLAVLQEAPDYLLDQPVEVIDNDEGTGFNVTYVEIVDIIEEGNRVQIIRLSNEEE